MEQQLAATFLRPGLIERALATGIGAVGVGTGIFLAAWGISFLWRYTPPEVAVRIANPEVRVIQDSPFSVTQDKPFVLAQPEPLKIDEVKVKIDQAPATSVSGATSDARSATGDVIKREVIVFSSVKHGPGSVFTGWKYQDGSGGKPFEQFCYYTIPNADYSSTRVDIAYNGSRSLHVSASLVPDLEVALGRCVWWQG
jgi:hypothetical protein